MIHSENPVDEKSIEVTVPILNYLRNAESEELPGKKLSQPCVIGNEEFSNFEHQLISSSTVEENGFVAVISLHDAKTLYVSSGISTALGYPQDMLLGQSIMGFLYPKDRLTFANLLSRGLQSRFCHASDSAVDSDGRFVFYVRIREYKGLKNCGFQVAAKKPKCKPFQLRCFIRDVVSAERLNVQEGSTQKSKEHEGQAPPDLLTICFVIVAIPIKSGHKLSEERNPAMAPFSTRHTSSCHFSYVDHSSISFLGYFPQDIIGFSIFNFYHEEDFVILKDIYNKVSIDASHSIRGKPVRFRVFNGDYVTLDTEWSSFVNPWTRKIEFIIGNHRIIQGPVNTDVFDDVNNKSHNEIIISADSKLVQNEIIDFLAKPVSRTTLSQITSESNGIKRKRKLAARVNEIIDGKALTSKEWSDKYSCVLGAVSPHLESSDSSSNTPPPFQEERLKDNIERFFASQPQTNCETCSSSGSYCQNNERSPDRTRSNDGSGSGSSDPQKGHSSIDSAFQSGSNEGSGNGNVTKNSTHPSKPPLETVPNGYVNIIPNESKSEKMTPNEVINRCHSHIESFRSFRNLTEEALSYHNRLLRHKSHQPKVSRNLSAGNDNQESQSGKCNQRRPCHSQEGSNHLRRSSAKKHARPSDEPGKRGPRGAETSVPSTSLFPPPYSMMLPMTWLPQPPIPKNLCSTCSNNFRQEQLQSNQVMLPVLCALPVSLSPTSSSNSHLPSSTSRNGFTQNSEKDNRDHRNPVTEQEQFAHRRSSRIRNDFASVCRKLFPSGDDERQRNEEVSNESGDKKGGDEESSGFTFSTSSSSLLPSSSESPNQYPEFMEEEKRDEATKFEVLKRMRKGLGTPTWIKNVNYTDDLIYRYKVERSWGDPPSKMESKAKPLVSQQLQILSDEFASEESSEQNPATDEGDENL